MIDHQYYVSMYNDFINRTIYQFIGSKNLRDNFIFKFEKQIED